MAGTDPGAGSRGLAESVLAGLIAQGLTDLVISPGSRSAPMAVAALAAEVGLSVAGVRRIGDRVVASLNAA